nr:ferrochelatase [uncultured Gammaproteobacteria bacterium]
MSLGILLVNLGTPKAPTAAAVRRYLREFLGDRRVVDLPGLWWRPLLYTVIAPLRARRVAKSYQAIWLEEGSPLWVYTQRLAQKLKAASGWQVEVGMVYGEPSLKTGLEALRARGVKEVLVWPLYPQYSKSTTAAVFDRFAQVLSGWPYLPACYFLNDYHAEAAYIEALAGQIKAFWQEHGRPERLLLSFHGLPEKSRAQGDPYYEQCLTSACLIAETLDLGAPDWQVVFQSRFGPAKWLGPYCTEVLASLPKEGIRKVDVVCPGFAVDCLETLEEIAVVNRNLFLAAGGEQYRYIPALNDSDAHVAMLAALIASRLQAPKVKRF